MGFKETFTRSGEQESNLQYDDTAFLYFSLSCIILLLVPLLYNLLRQLLDNSYSKKQALQMQYPTYSQKRSLVNKIEKRDKLNRFLVFRVVVVCILMVALYENLVKLW